MTTAEPLPDDPIITAARERVAQMKAGGWRGNEAQVREVNGGLTQNRTTDQTGK